MAQDWNVSPSFLTLFVPVVFDGLLRLENKWDVFAVIINILPQLPDYVVKYSIYLKEISMLSNTPDTNVTRNSNLVISDSSSANFGMPQLIQWGVIPAAGTALVLNLPANAVITNIDVINTTAVALTATTTLSTATNIVTPPQASVGNPILTAGVLTLTASAATSFGPTTFTNNAWQCSSTVATTQTFTLSLAVPALASLTIQVKYFINKLN